MSSKPKQSAAQKELEQISIQREKDLRVENARETTKTFSDNVAFRKKLRGIFSLLSGGFAGFPGGGSMGAGGGLGTSMGGGRSGGAAGGSSGGSSSRGGGGATRRRAISQGGITGASPASPAPRGPRGNTRR